MAEYEHIEHPFEPIFAPDARILVLGSLPSKLSRENDFYYGNPRNRFWTLMSAILECPEPPSTAGKAALLEERGIALWDVIAACDIRGSSDASIRNAHPVDIARILDACCIQAVFLNGRAAERLFKRYLQPQMPGIPARCLPSTSPANAAWRFPELCAEWKRALDPYLEGSRRPASDNGSSLLDDEDRRVGRAGNGIAD